MVQTARLEAFERMMADVSSQHAQTVEKMQALKAQGHIKVQPLLRRTAHPPHRAAVVSAVTRIHRNDPPR